MGLARSLESDHCSRAPCGLSTGRAGRTLATARSPARAWKAQPHAAPGRGTQRPPSPAAPPAAAQAAHGLRGPWCGTALARPPSCLQRLQPARGAAPRSRGRRPRRRRCTGGAAGFRSCPGRASPPEHPQKQLCVVDGGARSLRTCGTVPGRVALALGICLHSMYAKCAHTLWHALGYLGMCLRRLGMRHATGAAELCGHGARASVSGPGTPEHSRRGAAGRGRACALDNTLQRGVRARRHQRLQPLQHAGIVLPRARRPSVDTPASLGLPLPVLLPRRARRLGPIVA